MNRHLKSWLLISATMITSILHAQNVHKVWDNVIQANKYVDGWYMQMDSTKRKEFREFCKNNIVILDGASFCRIERMTHFICYRKTALNNERLMAFCSWLKAQLLITP